MALKLQLQQYPYTYLRTIIMKKALLTKADYDKILKMSPDEISKYLQDFEYKKEVDELGIQYTGVELVERALQKNLGNTFSKLQTISAEALKTLIRLYLERYDVYNIKSVLRGKFSGLTQEQIQQNVSPIQVQRGELVQKMLSMENIDDCLNALDTGDEKEKRTAIEYFKEHRSLAFIENALDRQYYAKVQKQIRTLTKEGKLYKRFLQNEIDVLNLKLLLRLKKEDTAESTIKELIFAYGTLQKDKIQRLVKMQIADILKELESTSFAQTVEHYTKDGAELNFADLEIDLDLYLIQQSRKLIRQFPMSVDVILGYLFLKDIEVRNLTRIIKGKELGVDEDFIKKIVVV